MRFRTFAGLPIIGAFVGSFLGAGVASAQYPPPPPPPPGYYAGPRGEPDGVRVRGGFLLQGGLLVVPGVVNAGDIELQGQAGVQINNNWGVYFIPGVDFIIGKYTGLGADLGLLFDYTFNNIPISVGGGPEIGGFVAVSSCQIGTAGCSVGGAGGAFYGARARFMFHPVMVRSDANPIRRKAFTIGLDVRALYGAFGASSTNINTNTGTVVGGYTFGLAPMIFLGYTSF
jgi:hypothetical protein